MPPTIARILLAASLACWTLAPGASAAPRTESGRTLVVPEKHADLGAVLYVDPGGGVQTAVISDAPLEHRRAVSRGVIGYAVVEEDASGAPNLLAGEFRMPVESLKTGLSGRDRRLHSSRWLHAERHPDVVFTLDATKNAQRRRQRDWSTTYTAELTGELTIKDVSRPVRISARLTRMPRSDRTRYRGPGDWLVIRGEFPVNLREFGFNDPLIGVGRIAETVRVELALFLSTVSPDANE